MKIGRVKFAVKEVFIADKKDKMQIEANNQVETGHASNSIYTTSDSQNFDEFVEVPSIMNASQDEENDEHKCRFCWMSGADPTNPLLGSCKCAGSVGFIHLQCLCNWLEIKR